MSTLGGLIGSNTIISGIGGRFPDAAYNSTNSAYLVVWADYNQSNTRIAGRRIDNNGAVIGSQFNISDGAGNGLMPSVCYNPTNNEWMVTWDDTRGGSDHVYGQRVRGSDGV